MSTTQFIEATSTDSYVREIHRRVVQLLNDPTLDRQQRELHVRRLQAMLVEHQTKMAVQSKKLSVKSAKEAAVANREHSHAVANPSQIAARNRELRNSERQKQVPQNPAGTVETITRSQPKCQVGYGGRKILTRTKL